MNPIFGNSMSQMSGWRKAKAGTMAWASRSADCFAIVVIMALAPGCARHRQPAPEVYRNPYHRPLLSPGTMFSMLPPAVQHTVRAETGDAEIEDILKDKSSGRLIYRIYFVNLERFPPLYVAAD